MHSVACHDMPPQLLDERLQQMVAVFADQHMRQQPGASPVAADRQARRRCLRDRLARAARQLWTHMPDHAKRAQHVVEQFGHILAQRTEHTAAGGTCTGVVQIRYWPATSSTRAPGATRLPERVLGSLRHAIGDAPRKSQWEATKQYLWQPKWLPHRQPDDRAQDDP